jgi:hypothetical protein
LGNLWATSFSLSLFSFPRDKKFCQTWIRSVHWGPTSQRRFSVLFSS